MDTGETIRATQRKEGWGGLAKVWSEAHSGPCSSVTLCSQRTNNKVLERLEVLLPLYR